MWSRRIRVDVRLVGLHAINNKDDVAVRGHMELRAGQPLDLNRDPELFQDDDLAVNVIAATGKWAGEQLGHVHTLMGAAVDGKNAAHYISALMDGDDSRLPAGLSGLRGKLQFGGETLEKTTHRPDGSKIAVYILFASGEDSSLVAAVENYLRAARMAVQLV